MAAPLLDFEQLPDDLLSLLVKLNDLRKLLLLILWTETVRF